MTDRGTAEVTIAPAAGSAEMDLVRVLFREYADWLDFDLCFQGFDDELDTLPGGILALIGQSSGHAGPSVARSRCRCRRGRLLLDRVEEFVEVTDLPAHTRGSGENQQHWQYRIRQ